MSVPWICCLSTCARWLERSRLKPYPYSTVPDRDSQTSKLATDRPSRLDPTYRLYVPGSRAQVAGVLQASALPRFRSYSIRSKASLLIPSPALSSSKEANTFLQRDSNLEIIAAWCGQDELPPHSSPYEGAISSSPCSICI